MPLLYKGELIGANRELEVMLHQLVDMSNNLQQMISKYQMHLFKNTYGDRRSISVIFVAIKRLLMYVTALGKAGEELFNKNILENKGKLNARIELMEAVLGSIEEVFLHIWAGVVSDEQTGHLRYADNITRRESKKMLNDIEATLKKFKSLGKKILREIKKMVK